LEPKKTKKEKTVIFAVFLTKKLRKQYSKRFKFLIIKKFDKYTTFTGTLKYKRIWGFFLDFGPYENIYKSI